MSKIFYIEDVFLEFSSNIMWDSRIESRDYNIIDNFTSIINSNKSLTRAQGGLLVKTLIKYEALVREIDPNFINLIENPQWRTTFRVLDYTRRATIKEIDGVLCVLLYFPYGFKKTYEDVFLKTFAPELKNTYSHELTANVLPLYEINLIVLHEFLSQWSFEIDDEFLEILSEVESIWENQENLIYRSRIVENEVKLLNASKETSDFFEKNKTGVLSDDIFLAKEMGYSLLAEDKNQSLFDKVVSSRENQFWTEDYDNFFEITEKISGKIVVIVDRTDDIHTWVEQFIDKGTQYGINKNLFKVCFREDEKDNEFNLWVNENSLGKDIKNGKFLIFKHKAPKWLFSGEERVRIVVTNMLFPVTHHITQKWIDGHSCVFYLGNVKASQIKGSKIVNL